ncbi:SpvB/TcaC N-terminal domain-containing protein [Puia sp.]|uniref:SpvB/TcaC N-terminal domain-containing protein n=1 Tax=Puia sp. TaxID=2045100 RepID=UPI002F42F571
MTRHYFIGGIILLAAMGFIVREPVRQKRRFDSFVVRSSGFAKVAGRLGKGMEAASAVPDDPIIDVPETPQTQGFVPTSIKDFKLADPTAGISLIDAPVANSQGNASLTFEMKLPAGRQGQQPDLPIQYNSDWGGSWLGNGWNLYTPAITIDTRWGVPRYDSALETEMYQLNGMQMAPTNNRSALVKRTSEKRFYPRVEGDFSKVIRHGNSPSTYWWEVTEKNGNRSCYGGTEQSGAVSNAVLKDDQNNIAYWALVETRDLNDNYVHYIYDTVTDPGVTGSTQPGRQLYLSQIYYTGTGTVDGPYKIEFIRDRQLKETKRKDVTIDARLGMKTVSADLLRKVNISFSGTPIRSYVLQYEEGAFYKTLLQSISELDSAGAVFYTHRFDYYDDVHKQNYTAADSIVRWNIPGDGIQGDLPNQIPAFTSEATAISSSKAMSKGGGGGVTVGSIFGDEWSKKASVGGFFSYNRDDQEGMVSLIDINGDGLPDKVFKQNGSLHYRANLGGATKTFGPSKPITGVSDISASNNISIGGGVQVVPYTLFVGYEHTEMNITTTVYFSDFNGDGLMDIANNGTVYFNHLDAQGNPVFTTTSTPTPNPILSGNVDSSFLLKDTALQARQEKMFPLQDVVKMWEAPYSGTVTVNAPVQLLVNPNDAGVANPKKDGVRVSIQLRGAVLWNTTIGPDDYSPKSPTGVSGLAVNKGDHLYFRLQSIYNGDDDQVSWDPIIDYTTPQLPTSDHKVSSHYQASADFILHSPSPSGMAKPGSIQVDGVFNKSLTTDTVTLSIVRLRNTISTVLYQQDFAPAETTSGNLTLPGPLAVDTSDQLYFLIRSRSYIDRSALQWLPHYAYVSFTDGTPVSGTDGKPTMEGFPVPDNSNYNTRVIAVAPYVPASQDPVVIVPQVSGGGDGILWLTIKGDDTIYAQRQINITGGAMSTAMDSIRFIRPANKPIYIEYATDTLNFALGLAAPMVAVYKDTTVIIAGTAKDSLIADTVLPANLYANPAQLFLGPLFRGWGQFALKGNTANLPIAEDSLNLNEVSSYPSDPGGYQDSASLTGLQDPSKTYFVTLFPDARKLQWSGYDTSVFVMAAEMSSSRLGLHDVSVDSTTAGGSAGSVNKQSRTVIDSYMAGGFSGPLGASAGTSKAQSTVSLDMMDMNGDLYPDVVTDGSIQYTLPGGGLGATVIAQPIGATTDFGTAEGGGLGGDFTRANPKNAPKSNAGAAENTAKHAIGLSGGLENNDDESISSWMDINGDGLIDRIYATGQVALNLGYRFAPAEPWGLGGIERGNSLSEGAGLGLNLWAGSFEGGYGMSRTTATNSFALNDVNGDGLPDQLSLGTVTDPQNPFLTTTVLNVRLNTGNGFGPYIPWKNFNQVTVNTSTGEALNFAATGVIPIPIIFIKIAINPFSNTGWGVARQNDAVLDVDGDGYADMLHSSNDGDLTASVSSIGRTNLLRFVKEPLGSTLTLEYSRAGNTYGMPQSKWVLAATTVFDGVRGDGVDTIRRQFSYAGGNQDRREREFYGFNSVTTRDLNTANQNKVYRSHVRQYLNSSYYNRGLLASEWLEDSAGNKYTQTNNLYDLRLVQDSVQFPALKQTQKLFYEGTATAGVSTIIQYDYDALGNVTKINDAGDGSQQDLRLTAITYHDLDAVYVKSVPASVEVTTAEGVRRKRTTAVNSTGDIINISEWLADGTAAKTDLTYDSYGNVATITQPANYKGQRMAYTYEYDNVVHNYNTKITDAFGYTTTKTYDYRFGLITGMINRNDEPTRYTLDNHGRVLTYTGPTELAAGLPYTIKVSYHPDSTISWAETRHYDPEDSADIPMVNFADGLGRSVQVKKQVALFKGKNAADDVQMAVSGRVIFDAFGRAVRTYYPTPEAIGANTYTYDSAFGGIESTTSYDVLNRVVKTVLADGATSSNKYSAAGGMFMIAGTDALNNRVENQFDVRGRKRSTKEYGPNGGITTQFGYDALNELIKSTDNAGNAFLATYDNLGRKLSAQHPDGGLTTFQYDPAGNVLKKATAEIHREMPDSGAIRYQYDYNRLTDIDYPVNYQNKVKYSYGAAGSGSKAGRVTLVEDASGGQEFFYGLQGAVKKIIRTVLISPIFATTFVSQQDYDTWGRIKTLTYPDGEAVSYHYNKAGDLLSMSGVKEGTAYTYVDQAGYDLYEARTYLRYGNHTENLYTYDSLRRRLVQLQTLSPTGQPISNNVYTYDAESNVLAVQTANGKQNYQYDNLYRLDSASGEYQGDKDSATYGVKVAYDDLYNIVHKSMHGAAGGQSYDQLYTYGKTPHQATQVGGNKYTYDANGNQLGYGDVENYYDEENRLIYYNHQGVLSQYTYDADGVMAIASSGGQQSLWVNGAPAGTVKHTNNYSAYVSPYLVSRSATFTKHYYIGDERIASKLGHGTFVNISFPQSGLTAGNVDYVARAAQMEQNQTAYYASLGVSPGPPTDKNYYAEPRNSGIPAPVFFDSTASNVPTGWPADTLTPPNGPPVYLPPIPSNDSAKAGYGFEDAGHLYENDQYFFHHDLTGSTTYVTNGEGSITQHDEYSPLGETFVEEHTGSFVTPYLFHAKERDEVSSYYAYGARFYDPALSQWLSVQDPLGDDFPLDGSGYGLVAATDDDDDAQSSPYMNPGLIVGRGLDPADNSRMGRGKTSESRSIKVQAKKSREPLSRKWQERFARWFPDRYEAPMSRHSVAIERRGSHAADVAWRSESDLADMGMELSESRQGRASQLSERRSFSEMPDQRGRNSTIYGLRRGGSSSSLSIDRESIISVVEEENSVAVPSMQPGVGGSVSGRRRKSSGSITVILHLARPRGGSPSQGGNGSR